MSSVGSVSGSSVSASIQALLMKFRSSAINGASGAQSPGASGSCHGSDSQADPASPTADGSDASSGSNSLMQQIQSAIDGAMQNIDPTQANDPSAILKAVRNAVGGVLQQNGIEPPHGGHFHHVHGKSGAGAPSDSDADATTALNPSDATSGTGGTPASGNANDPWSISGFGNTLDSTLNQNGIDPKQFGAEIFQIIFSAYGSNGSNSSSSNTSNGATGQLLDTTV